MKKKYRSVISGFTFSPIVGTMLFPAVLDGGFRVYLHPTFLIVYLAGLLVAYVQGIVIGVPVYFNIRKKIPYKGINLALTGSIVAVTPWLIHLLALAKVHTPIRLSSIFFLIGIGLCGFMAGLTFWFITKDSHIRRE